MKGLESVTEIKKDGKEKRVSVEEIENGFIIARHTEGNNEKGEWQHECKKWYSETNPLAKTDIPLSDMFK